MLSFVACTFSHFHVAIMHYLAIDLVLGGPPCVDYTYINARRKGVNGGQGKYLKELGQLIDRIQKHQLQQKRHLFFLTENTIRRGKDLDEISEAFRITPLEVDAHYFSPCRRKRHFFMNYPVDFDLTGVASDSDVRSCLNDGWMHPADAQSLGFEAKLRKANTFMASLSRIDDARMTVVKYDASQNAYIGRSITVLERERMMGLPESYVSKPGMR